MFESGLHILLAILAPVVAGAAAKFLLAEPLKSATHAWQVNFMRGIFYFGGGSMILDLLGVPIPYVLLSIFVVIPLVMIAPMPELSPTRVSAFAVPPMGAAGKWKRNAGLGAGAAMIAADTFMRHDEPIDLNQPAPEFLINPATGLPLTGGEGSPDVMGNAYGMNNMEQDISVGNEDHYAFDFSSDHGGDWND